MKPLKVSIVVASCAAILLLPGCSETTQSPVQPETQVPRVMPKVDVSQNPLPNLGNTGAVVHRVQGSTNIMYNGKNVVGTVTAHEFADGTFNGEYEINGANAFDETMQKWNGTVVFLKVYDNIAVIGGMEKTGVTQGLYDIFFVIDNGKNGKSSDPDQISMYVIVFSNLTTAQVWWNKPPAELIARIGVLPVDRGSVVVE